MKSIYQELVQNAFEAMAEGDYEEALSLSGQAISEDEDEPEAFIIAGAALLEMARYEEAVRFLEQGLIRAPEDAECQAMLGFGYFSLWNFEMAELAIEGALRRDVRLAEAHYWWGLLLERQGRFLEAEEAIYRAYLLSPRHFPLPFRVPREAFRRSVEEAIMMLPAGMIRALSELTIYISDFPSATLPGEEGVDPLISGLFSGIPRENAEPFPLVPDNRIYLFQRNIERVATDHAELVEEIRQTLEREVGFYLGLSSDGVGEEGFA
ncbi:MAG: hypothetical protein D6795_11480 [Deltaproteobacteria bacterium]|nr:MAG: hypothetical protein D6795_11480 [Deltaproteobacteria bacterium]